MNASRYHKISLEWGFVALRSGEPLIDSNPPDHSLARNNLCQFCLVPGQIAYSHFFQAAGLRLRLIYWHNMKLRVRRPGSSRNINPDPIFFSGTHVEVIDWLLSSRNFFDTEMVCLPDASSIRTAWAFAMGVICLPST
jgi:hypothetical protein